MHYSVAVDCVDALFVFVMVYAIVLGDFVICFDICLFLFRFICLLIFDVCVCFVLCFYLVFGFLICVVYVWVLLVRGLLFDLVSFLFCGWVGCIVGCIFIGV